MPGALGRVGVLVGVFSHGLQVGIWCGRAATATAAIRNSFSNPQEKTFG